MELDNHMGKIPVAGESSKWVGLVKLFGFSLLFAFPSFAVMDRHFGLFGVVTYLVAIILFWVLADRYLSRLDGFLNSRFFWIAGLLLAGMAVVFSIGYPIENAGGVLHSSDRDNALNLAGKRVLSGLTPYYPQSLEAGPLSLLPGAVLLGLPFVLIGNGAYQNFFWVFAFLMVAARWSAGRALALVMVSALMVLSPAALQEFISGGDMLSNGLYVAVAMMLAVMVLCGQDPRLGRLLIASVLLGVCLASRLNYFLLIPLYGAFAWRLAGLRLALISLGIVSLVTLGLCGAYYFHDPSGFSPLVTGHKLSALDRSFPYASKGLLLGMLVLSLFGSWRLFGGGADPEFGLFRWCAVVTLFPMLGAVVLFSMMGNGFNFDFLRDRYGLMYLPFALLGFGVPLLKQRLR